MQEAELGRPVSVIRSTERLLTSVVARPVERVRFEKYIVTEEKTFTVTLRREEVRLVREPLSVSDNTSRDANSASPTGIATGDQDYTFVLHQEQVAFTTTVVPVERVTLSKRSVTELQEITEGVRTEHVQVHPVVAHDDLTKA